MAKAKYFEEEAIREMLACAVGRGARRKPLILEANQPGSDYHQVARVFLGRAGYDSITGPRKNSSSWVRKIVRDWMREQGIFVAFPNLELDRLDKYARLAGFEPSFTSDRSPLQVSGPDQVKIGPHGTYFDIFDTLVMWVWIYSGELGRLAALQDPPAIQTRNQDGLDHWKLQSGLSRALMRSRREIEHVDPLAFLFKLREWLIRAGMPADQRYNDTVNMRYPLRWPWKRASDAICQESAPRFWGAIEELGRRNVALPDSCQAGRAVEFWIETRERALTDQLLPKLEAAIAVPDGYVQFWDRVDPIVRWLAQEHCGPVMAVTPGDETTSRFSKRSKPTSHQIRDTVERPSYTTLLAYELPADLR